MFDLHARVLPGLGGGPETIEGAVTALDALLVEGVRTVVAVTPLDAAREGQPCVPPGELKARARALGRLARLACLPVCVYAAHLLPLDERAEGALASGGAATIADGPYALVAAPAELYPQTARTIIGRLRRAGFVPVLAEPERNPAIQRDPSLVARLVEAGALAQVSLASLVGVHGERAQAAAEALLRDDLVHALASGRRGDGERPPHVEHGLRLAEMLVGRSRAWELTTETPHAILRGNPVEPRRAHAIYRPQDDRYRGRDAG